jgi:hypothetical protein
MKVRLKVVYEGVEYLGLCSKEDYDSLEESAPELVGEAFQDGALGMRLTDGTLLYMFNDACKRAAYIFTECKYGDF